MSIEVGVALRNDRRRVQFIGAGGLAKLLPAIVHTFKDSSLSEDGIMVINEKDETVLNPDDEIENGSSLKVIFRKPKAKSEREKVKANPSPSSIHEQDLQKMKTGLLQLSIEERAEQLISSTSTPTSLPCVGEYSEQELKERKRHREMKSKMLLEACLMVKVCFLLDCTGSMLPWITKIKDYILNWKECLLKTYTHAKFSFSFVRYTDFDQPEESRTSFLDFTEDTEKFSSFLKGIDIPADCGGDAAEDISSGLKVVTENLTWGHGTKVLIHIADAPCHGNQYHDSSIGDRYPDRSSGINDILNQLYRQQIQYYFGYIKKTDTEKMIAEFNDILCHLGGGQTYITQLDATDPKLVEMLVLDSLKESISKTLTCQLKESDIPKLETFVEERGLITPPFKPSVEIRLSFPSVITNVRRCPDSFAEGKCRRAYHGIIVDTNAHIVLKENKEDIELKRYLESYHAHITAMVYAIKFNKEKPPNVENLQFVSPSLFLVKIDSKWRCFFVEPYIKGSFKKFNNNGGYVFKAPSEMELASRISDALQAFSHYSWQKSEHKILVCDLQGVMTEKGALLTDPSIHSCTENLCYGSTDLASPGMDKFFDSHQCNKVCKAMKLEPYKKK